eukprot:1711902-Rhodomonas_salina.2
MGTDQEHGCVGGAMTRGCLCCLWLCACVRGRTTQDSGCTSTWRRRCRRVSEPPAGASPSSSRPAASSTCRPPRARELHLQHGAAGRERANDSRWRARGEGCVSTCEWRRSGLSAAPRQPESEAGLGASAALEMLRGHVCALQRDQRVKLTCNLSASQLPYIFSQAVHKTPAFKALRVAFATTLKLCTSAPP